MKIVVVSPHRDDAAFSLSLAIQFWLAAGQSVEVINCFTRSEYAPFSDAASVHANDRMSYVSALRSREDVMWRRQHGAGLTLRDLNLKDAPLRLHCSIDEVCSHDTNPADKTFAKVRSTLERTQADALVLPLGLGTHVDHLTARDAARAAWPMNSPCAFYEDLPYAARPGAAEEILASAHATDTRLEPFFISGPCADTKSAIALKRKSALCYDSQIDDETTESIAHFCARYEGRERLWANPSWMTLPGNATTAKVAR